MNVLLLTILILLLVQYINCYSTSNVNNNINRLYNNNRIKSNVNRLYMTSSDVKSMQWDLSLRSPCKINLFLRILGRRPTGYRKLTYIIYYTILYLMLIYYR